MKNRCCISLLVFSTLGSLSLNGQALFTPSGNLGAVTSGTGNVGVGTPTPGNKLTVSGVGNGSVDFSVNGRIQTGDGANNGGVWLNTSQTGLIGMEGNSTIGLYTYPFGWALSILSNGNVGIGTTAPASSLDVNGIVTAGGLKLNYGNLSFSSADGYGIYPTSNHWVRLNALSGGTGERYIVTVPQTSTGNVFDIEDTTAWVHYLELRASGDVAARRFVDIQGEGYFLDPASTGTSLVVAGNVGIGTTNPTQKLSVNGTIRAKEVIVDTGWSDYVFKPEYHLAPLSEVEGAIQKDGHLPGIPSASEVAEHGISVGDMQAKLLAKIEELTLHVIAQEKRHAELADEVHQLRSENLELRARKR